MQQREESWLQHRAFPSAGLPEPPERRTTAGSRPALAPVPTPPHSVRLQGRTSSIHSAGDRMQGQQPFSWDFCLCHSILPPVRLAAFFLLCFFSDPDMIWVDSFYFCCLRLLTFDTSTVLCPHHCRCPCYCHYCRICSNFRAWAHKRFYSICETMTSNDTIHFEKNKNKNKWYNLNKEYINKQNMQRVWCAESRPLFFIPPLLCHLVTSAWQHMKSIIPGSGFGIVSVFPGHTVSV